MSLKDKTLEEMKAREYVLAGELNEMEEEFLMLEWEELNREIEKLEAQQDDN